MTQITVTVPNNDVDALYAAREFFDRLANAGGTHEHGQPAPAPAPGPAPQAEQPAPAHDWSMVDKDGLPWDERIHAGTKTKKADGAWKAKPKVDKAYREQIEAELREMAAYRGTAQTPAPGSAPDPAPQAEQTVPAPGPATQQPAPEQPAPAPGPAPQQPAPASGEEITFQGLMQEISDAMTGGQLSDDRVNAAVQNAGVQHIGMLATRPDLLPSVRAELFGGGA